MIVDLGKPMPDTSGNDDDVARFELVSHSVPDGRTVAAWTVQHPDILISRGPSLHIRNVRSCYQGGGTINDVIYLAHQVMLGNRRLTRERATIDNSNVNMTLADIHGADLLIGNVVCDNPFRRALQICLQFVVADISRGTVVAGRFGILCAQREHHP